MLEFAKSKGKVNGKVLIFPEKNKISACSRVRFYFFLLIAMNYSEVSMKFQYLLFMMSLKDIIVFESKVPVSDEFTHP